MREFRYFRSLLQRAPGEMAPKSERANSSDGNKLLSEQRDTDGEHLAIVNAALERKTDLAVELLSKHLATTMLHVKERWKSQLWRNHGAVNLRRHLMAEIITIRQTNSLRMAAAKEQISTRLTVGLVIASLRS